MAENNDIDNLIGSQENQDANKNLDSSPSTQGRHTTIYPEFHFDFAVVP